MHSLNLIVRPVNTINKLADDGELASIADMKLYVSDGEKETVLFEIRWDYAVLKKWLLENRSRILNEELPEFFSSGKSIVEGISAFYEDIDPDAESLIDKAQEYRRSHGFRFALRGANIPNIYFGKMRNKLEISGGDEPTFWAFDVDGDIFFEELEK